MSAIEEKYRFDDDEYGIVFTQDSILDYKYIGNRTAHFSKQDHQLVQDSWLLLDDCSTIFIICNPHLIKDIHKVDH